MEKHKCKLCLRSFSNGRSLGGHMRSHMMNYPLHSKPQSSSSPTIQLSFEEKSSSEENSDNNNNITNNNICYGLRENPKKSFRLEDPEFSSMMLKDRETEPNSGKNQTWYETSNNYRSRMTRKLSVLDDCNNDESEAMMKKIKLLSKGSDEIESWVVDHEPLSSVFDVAFCLMMMSRDHRWKRKKDQEKEQLMKNNGYCDYYTKEEDEDDIEKFFSHDEESDASSEEKSRVSKNKVRGGKYKCETCNKVFRSYQALGGHRASHKRIKVKISRVNNDEQELMENENGGNSSFDSMVVEKKIHECPICLRVFASGQALGGHKRTHFIGLAPTSSTTIIKSSQDSTSTKHGNKFIDLNLPAQGDNGNNDDINHIENSAVSSADFVKTY